jgi:hypothetical protein
MFDCPARMKTFTGLAVIFRSSAADRDEEGLEKQIVNISNRQTTWKDTRIIRALLFKYSSPRYRQQVTDG